MILLSYLIGGHPVPTNASTPSHACKVPLLHHAFDAYRTTVWLSQTSARDPTRPGSLVLAGVCAGTRLLLPRRRRVQEGVELVQGHGFDLDVVQVGLFGGTKL